MIIVIDKEKKKEYDMIKFIIKKIKLRSKLLQKENKEKRKKKPDGVILS